MPYLQFDTDFPIDEATATRFQETVAEHYAEQMDADTAYTAVTVRDEVSIFLGRAEGDRRVVLKADVREGRSVERKRDLALDLIALVTETFDVPRANQKVVFTEHAGHQMMGADRVGEDWAQGDDGADGPD